MTLWLLFIGSELAMLAVLGLWVKWAPKDEDLDNENER
jgi:hypothetical protein